MGGSLFVIRLLRSQKPGFDPPPVDLKSGYEECYHVSAGREAWAEALTDPKEPIFRVTKFYSNDNKPMRTEFINARSLGTLVELLARGDFYCVMVQRDEPEQNEAYGVTDAERMVDL